MSEAIKSIYQQVIEAAKAKREASENTWWEHFKADRIDPIVRKLQVIEKAARPKHGFGGAFA